MATADTRVAAPLEAARALAPLIRSQAEEIEAARELPRPLFEALADAGLFHLLVPRSIGGGELDLPTYVRVIEELAKADASTAWAINQGAVFATYAAYLPPRVAREVWIDTPRGVVSNSPVPLATAVPVEGGFRVSGSLVFSTGCRHAAWLAAHTRVVEGGRPRLQTDGQPETRYCLLPVAEGRLLDTWHTRGMRGTGTHNAAVDDVFVPEERTFAQGISPPREPGPLYAVPRILTFPSGDAAVALGVARSSLEAFVELAGAKTPQRTAALLRDQPTVQAAVGRAEAQLRAARAFLMEAVADTWAEACAAGAVSLDQRVVLRTATTHAIRQAVEVVDTVYNNAGTTGVYLDSPIQRHFQDIHVISQHIQSRESLFELVGQHYLKLDADPTWLGG